MKEKIHQAGGVMGRAGNKPFYTAYPAGGQLDTAAMVEAMLFISICDFAFRRTPPKWHPTQHLI